MKKLKRRALAVLLLAALMVCGLAVFSLRLYNEGAAWAAFRANGNIYSAGRLTRGSILSREGEVLARLTEDGIEYADDKDTRLATVHIIGDRAGNIANGATGLYREELCGYSLVDGLYSEDIAGGTAVLSVSAELSKAALAALDGRNGAIGVVNYKTGEILCMVSAPTFDPDGNGSDIEDGAYLNNFLSSSFTPGSVFKLITLAAAIENIPDLYERDFHCEGSEEIDGAMVSCVSPHGDMKIEDALAKSCNCVFASLACELGGGVMAEYAERLSFTESFYIDGAKTASGRYEAGEGETSVLAWSGAGQGRDLVVPAAMLRYVAAIANGGVAKNFTLLAGGSQGSERLLKKETADMIARMMDYNVYLTYGRENFPGLSLAAKSGTAEVGGGMEPNAWFVGFSSDESFPLAFVVVIENGGSGTYAAGRAANDVLQAAKGLF